MSENSDWSYSESKDWKDGRHKRENEFVYGHAGEVGNRDTRRFLTALESAYQRAYQRGWLNDDWPESVEDTNLYQEIRADADTEAYGRRVEQEPEKLRAHVGTAGDEIDVSGWETIEKVRNQIVDEHLRLYIYGEPGSGKTSAGCLVARHWMEQRDERLTPTIYTNIRTLAEGRANIKWVSRWSELQTEIQKHSRIDGGTDPFMFLFDEASSQASGGRNGYEASTKLAELVYKIRKYGGSLCIIGHDGKDIVPSVRVLCRVLHKPDKKTARLYESIRNREGQDPITPEINGWPDSKWSPDEYDPAPWEWTEQGDDDDRGEGYTEKEMCIFLAIRFREQGYSTQETAEIVGYSAGWVSSRWQGYQNGEDEKELVEQISE